MREMRENFYVYSNQKTLERIFTKHTKTVVDNL